MATVGSPCTNAAGCATLGTGAKCKLTTTRADGTYTGGYCTLGCNNNVACPASSICINVDSDGGSNHLCLATCRAPRQGQSSCRPGYLCEVSGPSIGTGICLPRCDSPGFTCYPNTKCDVKSGYCLAKR